MKRQILAACCALALSAGILSTGIVGAQDVVVRVAPPAPLVETAPPSPHRGWVWIHGYHRWDGRSYVWVSGRWAAPPRPRARWVDGHWVHRRGGYVWVDGRWR